MSVERDLVHIEFFLIIPFCLSVVEGVSLIIFSTILTQEQLSVLLIFFVVLGLILYFEFFVHSIRSTIDQINLYYLLVIILVSFILFFSTQYYFLLKIDITSMVGVATNPIDLFYNSLMVFVFSPVFTPVSSAAKILVILELFSTILLVLFVLQDMKTIRNLKIRS